MKGSVALFVGALPILVSCLHSGPWVRETNAWSSASTATCFQCFDVRPTFPTAADSSSVPRCRVSRSSRSNKAPPRPARLRAHASIRTRRPRRRFAGGWAVSFGSTSVAGVEGTSGLHRDPIARFSVGGVGAAAEAAAAAAAAASTAVVDEGDMICQRLEGVVSREARVADQEILLRVAHLDDFFAIADVRFDVFSPVHSTLKHRFRERSCLLMKDRRRRGAFCLVAALGCPAGAAAAAAAADGDTDALRDGGGSGVGVDVGGQVSTGHILGTLECSRHEFDNTPLEVHVEEGGSKIARLYLTEVAVRSDCRRKGVGRFLLGLVDDVAKELKTFEVFLHVNEINEAALGLYESCGYSEAPDNPSNRAFTNSLGLAGGFIGQRHRLLHKTYRSPDVGDSSSSSNSGSARGSAQ